MASQYLKADVLARAEALGIKARQIVEGLRVGDHKSPFRGFSVEFVQHREYVPGDDIRHIDWKSYGRSERYTIKQYEQETNFACHLLLDGSKSMQYGEGDSNKLEYAKLLTAIISYMVIRQRDSVGLHVFDEKIRFKLPASSNLVQINTILRTLEELDPEEKTAMGPLLEQIAETTRRRGIIFVISDAFDEVEPLLKGLRALRYLGHEVTLFHTLHPDEINFPFSGNLKFDGLEIPEEIKTRPHLIRPNYLRIFNAYIEELQKGCNASRIDYVQLDTSKPLVEVLPQYLVRRLQMGRG